MTNLAVRAGTPSVLDRLRLSLPDIAELAHVQRPVVSVWRRRHASGARPFPEAVSDRNGSPRFRASDVVGWISETGLGNNPNFAADVALRAAFDDEGLVATDGLLALLCLKAYTSMPLSGMSAGEVLDLADELDPEDAFLYREVAGLGPNLGAVCELADLAASAAYTPGGAAEAALADRFRVGRRDLTSSALAPAALELVARVAEMLVGSGTLADPYPGCGDLVTAVLRNPRLIDLPTVQVPGGDAHRLVRRRLAAHGWDAERLDLDAELLHDAVVVTQLPPTGSPELDDEEVIARVDDIVLRLRPGQRAVVIGPASALVDAAATPAVESARSALLRTDRLRTAVLLPPGLVTERPRQRLALWVLGDAHPDVHIRDRWTMVADLSDQGVSGDQFDRAVVEDLLTDITASLGTAEAVRSHAFRFARFASIPDVLARGGSLVAAGRSVVRGARDDGGAAAVSLTELVASVESAARPRLEVRVERGEARPVRRVPLGTFDRRWIKRVSGNRIDVRDVVPAPERDAALTRVVGVPELVGESAWGSRGVETLTFTGKYPAARLTEPGDVVFTTTPYPAAVVDNDGFSAVAFPAQILRISKPERAREYVLLPEVLARDICAQPPGAKWWRAWEVRLVPASDADSVARTLTSVADRLAAAKQEIGRLEQIASTLVDGVTSGVVRMRKDEATA
ncbi:hypothetical protein [Isoptericola variabilis]|uniref:DNA methylase adenine-specific domain-containing protein n=1 Tax=Isoptericola variabilis (strain 225) TaxID=743718 RepID=F6FPE2_ISOV2|nr:hypothetical protein [Isoptericola variabilis]AEG43655.1 hypothetical protein Isova_0871 [Isoptericola variabilis 225]TWH27336.1 hypothetical protein L600_000500000090 [Isoptericola variabilis J7]